jgi:hypothetical protein
LISRIVTVSLEVYCIDICPLMSDHRVGVVCIEKVPDGNTLGLGVLQTRSLQFRPQVNGEMIANY